jgi:hypothetical protein
MRLSKPGMLDGDGEDDGSHSRWDVWTSEPRSWLSSGRAIRMPGWPAGWRKRYSSALTTRSAGRVRSVDRARSAAIAARASARACDDGWL